VLPASLAVLLLAVVAAPAAHAAAPTFGTVKTLSAGAIDPRSLVAADLDDDGRLDLIAGDRNADSGRVTVRRNLGAGLFGSPVGSPYDPGVLGAGVGPVVAGDFTGDGRTDVLAGLATGSVTNQLVLLDGDGTGRLTPDATGPITTRSNLTGLAAADLDADGDLDALTSHEVGTTSSELGVLRGAGAAPAFVNSYGAGGTSMAMALAAGDLDGDGNPDVLVVGRNAGAGSAWVATSTGVSFSALIPVAVGPQPVAVALADVDDDGDLDGLVADGSTGLLSVLTNDGAGILTSTGLPVSGLGAGSGIAASDLNGDGDADVVVTDAATGRAGVMLGDGRGGFGAPTWLTMGDGARSPVIADLDGDGVPDLATADAVDATISVRLGTGAPAPQAAGSGAFASEPVGTTGPPQTITITNTGSARLKVASATVVGAGADDFLMTQNSCSGAALAAGGTDACALHLRFAPSQIGVRSATLRLAYQGGRVLDVALSGTGEDAHATTATAPATATTTTPAATTTAVTPVAPPPATRIVTTVAHEPASPPKRPAKLVLTLDRTRLEPSKPGVKLNLRFALGRAAKLILRVKTGARTVEIVRATAKNGRGTISWDGRLGKQAAPAGTYRLALLAVAADGAMARATATVTIGS